VLLSIAGGSDHGLFEINESASLVQEAAHPDANIIFGTVIDDSLGDEVRVTVIAAGFDSGSPTHKKLEPAPVTSRVPMASAQAGHVGGSAAQPPPPANRPQGSGNPPPAGSPHPSAPRGEVPPSGGQDRPPGGNPPARPPASGQPHPGTRPPRPQRPNDDPDDEVDVPPFMRR
jgi:cell division protein FtsZ